MSEVLEQEEVDALLKGVTTGSVDTSPHTPARDGEVRGFDLGLQARVLRSRLPVLESINEKVARILRASMHTLMDRPIEFNVGQVGAVRYADYMASLSFPTSLNVIRFAPLAGAGLIVIEAKLVTALTDLFYGGNGRSGRPAGRDFSPTEDQMIESLLELLGPALVEGWEPVQPASIEHIRRDNTPAFVTIVAPNETMIVSRFAVGIEGMGGEIHFVLPYASIEPLKEVLRASVSTEQHQSEAVIANWSTVLRNELEDAEVDLVTVLGSARQTVGGLLDLRPGDVIPCDFDGRATVLVNGTPLFWGELGQQRGKQVVRISVMNSRKTSNLLDGLAGGHS